MKVQIIVFFKFLRFFFKGTLVGIEHLPSKQKTLVPFLTIWTNVPIDGTLKSLNLQDMVDLEFLDDPLKADLQHVLQVLIAAKKKDSKPLSIFASGKLIFNLAQKLFFYF